MAKVIKFDDARRYERRDEKERQANITALKEKRRIEAERAEIHAYYASAFERIVGQWMSLTNPFREGLHMEKDIAVKREQLANDFFANGIGPTFWEVADHE